MDAKRAKASLPHCQLQTDAETPCSFLRSRSVIRREGLYLSGNWKLAPAGSAPLLAPNCYLLTY